MRRPLLFSSWIFAFFGLASPPLLAQKRSWQTPNGQVNILTDVRDAAELNLPFQVLPISLRNSSDLIGMGEDGRGYLWLTHNVGVSRFDGYDWRFFASDPVDTTSLLSEWAGGVDFDENGDPWFACDGGICHFIDSSESFESFRHMDYFIGPSTGGTLMRTLRADKKGGLWCGSTAIGLCRFDLEKRLFDCKMSKTITDLTDSSDLRPPISIPSIALDEKGLLWCAGFQQNYQQSRLHSFDPKTGAWQRFTFEKMHLDLTQKTQFSERKNTVWGITQDAADSIIWVNGPAAGLRKFNKNTLRWEQFFIDGAFSDADQTDGEMQPFADSLLVIGRGDGYFIFQKAKKTMFRVSKIGDFDQAFGRLVSQNRFGDLWLTSQFALFKLENPRPVQPDSVARRPRLWIKSFLADGSEKIAHPTTRPTEIRLADGCRTVEIAFYGLPFMVPNRLEYRYFLAKKGAFSIEKGSKNENWVDLGQRHDLHFDGLAGGEHRLFLQTRRPGEAWSEAVELAFFIEIPFWKNPFFQAVAALVLFGGGIFFYRMKIREARQEADFRRQLAEVEMASLRAQMNPHFLFNCLAGINHLVQKNDRERASIYLTKFSRLVHLILENSKNARISLQNDLDALRLYLDMEALRFEPRLQFELFVAPEIDAEMWRVPPLLIQPFVENAIWHGLMQKVGGGKVTVRCEADGGEKGATAGFKISIIDDGIGRQKAAELASRDALKTKSHGLRITGDRIRLLNDLHGSAASVQVFDLKNEAGEAVGTLVELRFSA